MNLKTTIKIALVTLLILNGVLIYLLVSKPSKPGRLMDHPRKSMGERRSPVIDLVSDRLGLDKDQRAEYLKMAEKHHSNMVAIEKEEKDAIKSYLGYLKSDPDQSLSKDELQKKVEKLEGDKLNMTFKHFEDLKSLCNEKQLEKIDTVIEEMMKVLTDGGEKNGPPMRR